MHITVVTVACFGAALIAGTTPVRAQTLPVYDVDAETARCVTEAETGKEWTGALKNWCQAIGKDERLAHDQLAERWDSYDKGKRMSCVADKAIADYSSLKSCLERAEMERPQDQNQARAAAEAEANQKAYLDAISMRTKATCTGAIADYNEAIRLKPNYATAFCNRGIARQKLNNGRDNDDKAKARQLDASACR